MQESALRSENVLVNVNAATNSKQNVAATNTEEDEEEYIEEDEEECVEEDATEEDEDEDNDEDEEEGEDEDDDEDDFLGDPSDEGPPKAKRQKIAPNASVQDILSTITKHLDAHNLGTVRLASANKPPFSHIFLNETFSDVSFVVNGTAYPVHRLVMCHQKSFFSGLVHTSGMQESQRSVIHLHDVGNGDVFKELLRFVYEGVAEVGVSRFLELFRLADRFHLDALVEACKDFLARSMNCQNFSMLAHLAYKMTSIDPRSPAVDVCLSEAAKVAEDIFAGEKHVVVDFETFKRFLDRDDLRASEFSILCAVRSWCLLRSKWRIDDPEAAQLIDRVRFYMMNDKELTLATEMKMVNPSILLEAYRIMVSELSMHAIRVQFVTKHGVPAPVRLHPRRGIAFEGSRILSEPHVSQLTEWMDRTPDQTNRNRWMMVYSARAHGFGTTHFHERVDGKKKLLVVVKSACGTYGCYIGARLDNEGAYRSNPRGFVFILESNVFQPSQKLETKDASLNKVYDGPSYTLVLGSSREQDFAIHASRPMVHVKFGRTFEEPSVRAEMMQEGNSNKLHFQSVIQELEAFCED